MMKVDVLVVGLGPGGGCAAAAAAGCRVLAVDRRRRIGEPVQCAEFIPMPLGRYARADGVLKQRIDGMKSTLPSGAVRRSPFPGLMIDRAAFDRALAERAQLAGAELRAHTRLAALDLVAGRAVLASAHGCETVAFGALIAADGPHSATARLAGLPALATVQTRQYTVPLMRAYRDTDIWLSDDFPGGYGWLFPKGPVANLGLGADPRFAADLKAPLDRLHRELADAGLVGREILARTGGAIPVGGMRARLVAGGIVFVGDAAGLTHPITGGGIAAAVTSGEAAGRAVADYLGSGDAGALVSYEEDMRDQFGPTLARAVARRRYLAGHWRKPSARDDAVQRRGWIAFEEYFESDARFKIQDTR